MDNTATPVLRLFTWNHNLNLVVALAKKQGDQQSHYDSSDGRPLLWGSIQHKFRAHWGTGRKSYFSVEQRGELANSAIPRADISVPKNIYF